jgi:hypothetical protein
MGDSRMTEQMIKQIKELLQRSKRFIALGAFESLVIENEQLKQQIEEMKNCYNCSNFCDRNVDCSSICVRNNPTVKQLKDYWKMKDIY